MMPEDVVFILSDCIAFYLGKFDLVWEIEFFFFFFKGKRNKAISLRKKQKKNIEKNSCLTWGYKVWHACRERMHICWLSSN